MRREEALFHMRLLVNEARGKRYSHEFNRETSNSLRFHLLEDSKIHKMIGEKQFSYSHSSHF